MINRVLIYNSGGGIGDAIQILPLINAVKNEFKSAELFYLCSHENHFNSKLKNLNSTINSLDLNIKYFGFRWWHFLLIKQKIKKLNIKKFDLIIDLQSKIRNTLILRMIPHKYFVSACFNFKLSNPKINIKKSKKNNNNIIKAINIFMNTNCKLIQYDTSNIDNRFNEEAKRLLPHNNYVGISITQGNAYRKKEWPINKVIDLCAALKSKSKIPVFFIEKKNKELKNKISRLISDSLFPEHETELSCPALVTCLGKRLDFAISIDNGVMHMLSLSKVPMIVLFGPTNSEKFAPEYDDLIILDSKKLKDTNNVSAINVEDVLKAAKHHSNFLY